MPGSRGIGEIGSAARGFIDWMRSAGLGVWQFLPTGPIGYGNSPYQPLSVFAGNVLFVDLDALAADGLLTRDELESYPEFGEGPVDYSRVTRAKRQTVQAAAAHFRTRADDALEAEYAEFVTAHDPLWLHDYALYATLKERHGQVAWTDWDGAYRRRDRAAIADWEESASAAIERIKIGQFLYFRQWQALRAYAAESGVDLFGDLPIYMALDCAEAWARPDLLLLDARGRPIDVAGVPPDYFSDDGQLWGNPLYRWEVHEREGFRWWIARLEHALQCLDLVRLDHFRGFEAYWAVPAGAETAKEGEWRPGPGHRFFDAVLEVLDAGRVVAEDLGLITDAVIDLRREHGIAGMFVLQFMVDHPDFDLTAVTEDSVCYTGTHDNDTTVGWFSGSQRGFDDTELAAWQDRVLSHVGGSRDEIAWNLIALAFSSRARLAVATMQDYLGLDSSARMNRPGAAAGNWRWRLTPGMLDSAASDRIRAMIEGAGRK